MCPEAHARKSKPRRATAPPTASDRTVGFASSMKTTAQTKPSGTRQRCTQVPPLRATRVHLDRLENSLGAPKPLADGGDHSLDLDVHANPVRARAPVTVRAASDVFTLDADVVRMGRAVSPPLRRPEKPDDRRAGGDGEVRRPRVAADVDAGATRERVETFERRAGRECRDGAPRLDNALGQLPLAGRVRDYGAQAVVETE